MPKCPNPRKRRPYFDRLERRDTPATWGIAWPEAQHLSLSFVPDGTSIEGQPSQLFKTLDGQLGAGNWEASLLNAFQTWAVNSNINIGQVADGGQPLGAAGGAQGDPRFGDIRISAVPLPANVAAITAPYDPATGTVSGDMIINSNDNFAAKSGYDLFTVALHEAGHVFGFADSSDPASFMYNVYQGAQTSLGSAAISALQGLYGGPRNLLAQGLGMGSSDPSHPLDLSGALNSGAAAATASGDLSATTTANYFQFQVPSYTQAPLGLDLQVQTGGISQLIPQITITNSSGAVVGRSSAGSSSSGGTSFHLNGFAPGSVYKVQVTSPSNDIHAIGSYVLSVAATRFSDSVNVVNNKATPLNGNKANGTATLTASSQISSTRQEDLYSFVTPAQGTINPTIQLQGNGVGLNASQVDLYNSQGNLIGTATASDPQRPIASISPNALAPNATYYIKVTTGTINAYQFGTYQLSVAYGAAATAAPALAIIQTPWLGNSTAKLSSPNTDLQDAAQLVTPTGLAPGSFYAAIAGIGNATTSHYYQVKAPQLGATSFMTVSIQAIGGSRFLPWLAASDPAGNALPYQVLSNSGGVDVIQVAYSGAAKIVLKVAASAANGGGSIGNYYLDATFGTVGSALGTLAVGSVGTGIPGATAVLAPPSPTLYQFVLAGTAANAGTDALLRMTVTNSAGQVVATLTTPAGEAASINLMLADSSYTIYVDAYSPSGTAAAALQYALSGTNLTDPMKVYGSGGTGSSQTH